MLVAAKPRKSPDFRAFLSLGDNFCLPQPWGINRVTLSRVLNGKAGISIDLALRLEAWLDGPTAETWLKGQLAYDLWQAEQHRPAVSVWHAQAT